MNEPKPLPGLVIATYGRHYQVTHNDSIYRCVTRGKQSGVACGDRVVFEVTASGQGVIESILPRDNLLHRSVEHRSKLIAANVSLIVIVVAPEPSFYDLLINRCLVAAEAAHIRPIICLNKFDLGEPAQAALVRLQPYITLGYPVIAVSAHHDIAPLRPYMAGQTSVFVGQSGMGKSSLINALAPDARTTVGDISQALDSGRHTTTSARMYALDASSRLIDSPGMQSFGLNHVQADQLDQLFVEFRPYIGRCKFNNCRHVHEPGCAVIAASAREEISLTRLAAYQAILASLSSPQR
jgi:ribosome biogenesis GTPase